LLLAGKCYDRTLMQLSLYCKMITGHHVEAELCPFMPTWLDSGASDSNKRMYGLIDKEQVGQSRIPRGDTLSGGGVASNCPGILRINSTAQAGRMSWDLCFRPDLLHDRRLGKLPIVSLVFPSRKR
jgi:hypothetical protein